MMNGIPNRHEYAIHLRCPDCRKSFFEKLHFIPLPRFHPGKLKLFFSLFRYLCVNSFFTSRSKLFTELHTAFQSRVSTNYDQPHSMSRHRLSAFPMNPVLPQRIPTSCYTTTYPPKGPTLNLSFHSLSRNSINCIPC